MARQPTRAEIKAVRGVLYERQRLRKLADLGDSIAVLMNLDSTKTLPPDDVRNPPGSGPQWFYPDTGAVNQQVIDAAGLCEQLASRLLEMHDELKQVSFPEVDKGHLMTALREEAASWSMRGRLWKAPNKPDPKQEAAQIGAHFAASLDAVRHVQQYLKPKSEVHFG